VVVVILFLAIILIIYLALEEMEALSFVELKRLQTG